MTHNKSIAQFENRHVIVGYWKVLRKIPVLYHLMYTEITLSVAITYLIEIPDDIGNGEPEVVHKEQFYFNDEIYMFIYYLYLL